MTPAAFATVSVLALLALFVVAVFLAAVTGNRDHDRLPRLTRGDMFVSIILIAALWFSAYATVGGFA